MLAFFVTQCLIIGFDAAVIGLFLAVEFALAIPLQLLQFLDGLFRANLNQFQRLINPILRIAVQALPYPFWEGSALTAIKTN